MSCDRCMDPLVYFFFVIETKYVNYIFIDYINYQHDALTIIYS